MKKALIALFTFCASNFLFSQEALKSIEEEYYDYLSLQGLMTRPTLNYRTLSDSEWKFNTDEEGNSLKDSEKNVWKNNNLGEKLTIYESDSTEKNFFTKGIERKIKFKLYGPEWFNSYNSKIPYGQNDGALWQGAGYNTSLTGGARVEGYGAEITLKPQISFSQNKDFYYIPGVYGDAHSYFYTGNIDLVQRYGDTSFWNYDWGDTEIRYTWHNLTMGLGWQSPWLGPAWLNPMLGSNNAPSYPKIDAGLRKTKVEFFGINFGEIEGRIWLGKLSESKYFDEDETNNERMVQGLSATYAPSFLPGLTLGINRVFVTYWKSENLKYFKQLFTPSNPIEIALAGGTEDQKFALNANWIFPTAGLEVYGEFGVDDGSPNIFINTFHTAIYTVGLKKTIDFNFNKLYEKLPNIKGEIIFEWNNFEMSQDFQIQWQYMGYYSHSLVKQGYTQRGQILGAGSGYFGNSQYLACKFYILKGYVMPFIHRWCPDNNYIYNMSVNTSANIEDELYIKHYAAFKTYFTLGINFDYFVTDSLQFFGALTTSYVYCPTWCYFDEKAESKDFRAYHIELGLKYNF